MKYLKLINSKLFIQVDDYLFNELNQYQWFLNMKGYVFRWENNRRIFLHRFIINAIKGQIVDHIDNNPLNNQLNNLRICTNKENSYNKQLYKNNTSGYKGVFYHHEFRGKNKYLKEYWKVILTIEGKQKTKKFPYTNEGKIQAALYYNELAKQYFKDFAKLNIINN